MTGDDLAAAIERCGFTCCECQSTMVQLDWTPALGWIPVIIHWQLADGSWCPALHGGPAARPASLDLLDCLAAVATMSDYNEPEPWHRRELIGTL